MTDKEFPDLPPITAVHQVPMQPAFADIAVIPSDRNRAIENLDQIPEIVEAPLVEPVKRCWEKNVPTYTSSANGAHTEAYIGFDYDHMSADNQRIMDEMTAADAQQPEEQRQIKVFRPGENPGDTDPRVRVTISKPLEGETPESIGQFFTDIADRFVEQDLSWAAIDAIPGEDLLGYGFVVAEDGKFYRSAELAAKQNSWLAKQAGGTA